MTPDSKPFSALLLCGGLSQRMQKDKAFLTWDHQPLWQVQLQKLEQCHPKEIFISRQITQTPLPASYPHLPDSQDHAGPLEGIYQGLKAATTPSLVVLAIDLPLIQISTLQSLIDASRLHSRVIYRSQNFLEPLVACYSKNDLMEIERLLKSESKENRSPQSLWKNWISDNKAFVLETLPTQASEFKNWNTPSDL